MFLPVVDTLEIFQMAFYECTFWEFLVSVHNGMHLCMVYIYRWGGYGRIRFEEGGRLVFILALLVVPKYVCFISSKNIRINS